MRIIYFGASWCGMCHVLKPQVQAFCKDKGIELEDVDAEAQEERAQQYNIRNLPTIIVEDGERTIRATGMAQWNQIKNNL